MRSLTISNLVLIILNDSIDDTIRRKAEMELKSRLKYHYISYDEVLYEEGRRIEKRGLDIKNYLFSNNPTIQQLMELYFTYVCYNSWNNNMLLFSERHLCNQMNFCASFFDKISENEIIRLNEVIENITIDSNFNEYYNLKLVRDVLLERKKQMQEEQQREFRNLDILEFNESLLYFNDYGFVYSKNDILNRLYGLKLVLDDSIKLKKQKDTLLKQSENKILIDYSSDAMQKALNRIKTKKVIEKK